MRNSAAQRHGPLRYARCPKRDSLASALQAAAGHSALLAVVVLLVIVFCIATPTLYAEATAAGRRGSTSMLEDFSDHDHHDDLHMTAAGPRHLVASDVASSAANDVAAANTIQLSANSFSSLAAAIMAANDSPKKLVAVTITSHIKLTGRLPSLSASGASLLLQGGPGCTYDNGKSVKCTIDGGNKYPFISAGPIACSVAIHNLKVRQAKGGVVSGPCNVALRNSAFEDNWADSGGVINDADSPVLSSIQITRCNFARNGATEGDGGVLYAQDTGSIQKVSVAYSNFTDNKSLKGNGGVFGILYSGGTLSLRGSSFSNNQAYGSGGVAHAILDFFSSIDSSFSNNAAQTGEGGVLSVPQFPEINAKFCNSKFDGNRAAKSRSSNVFFTGNDNDGVAYLGFCKTVPPGVYRVGQKKAVKSCEGCSGCLFDCAKKGTCQLDADFNPSCSCVNGWDASIFCLDCLPFGDRKKACGKCFAGFERRSNGSCIACPGVTKVPLLQEERLVSAYGASAIVKSSQECQKFFDKTRTQGYPVKNVWIFFTKTSSSACAGSCITFSAETSDLCKAAEGIQQLPQYGLMYKAQEDPSRLAEVCT